MPGKKRQSRPLLPTPSLAFTGPPVHSFRPLLPTLQAGAAAASGGSDEFPQNPEVDDAAAYAVQQLSSQSNSLFPYALKKVHVFAEASKSWRLQPGQRRTPPGAVCCRARPAAGRQAAAVGAANCSAHVAPSSR